jgi:hypothetical protein
VDDLFHQTQRGALDLWARLRGSPFPGWEPEVQAVPEAEEALEGVGSPLATPGEGIGPVPEEAAYPRAFEWDDSSADEMQDREAVSARDWEATVGAGPTTTDRGADVAAEEFGIMDDDDLEVRSPVGEDSWIESDDDLALDFDENAPGPDRGAAVLEGSEEGEEEEEPGDQEASEVEWDEAYDEGEDEDGDAGDSEEEDEFEEEGRELRAPAREPYEEESTPEAPAPRHPKDRGDGDAFGAGIY